MIFGPPALIPPEFHLPHSMIECAVVQQRPMLRLGDVTIEADRVEVELDSRRHTFHGRVLLRYFETTMEAETGIVDLLNGKVQLSGSLSIKDPWGTIHAKEVEADIEEVTSEDGESTFLFKGGFAHDVEIVALEGKFHAKEMKIGPRAPGGPEAMVIQLNGVMATACDRETPDFQFRFKELTIRTGDRATWKGGELWLGKNFKLPFPDYYTLLAPRETGIALPQPTLTSGFRPGYRWHNLTSIGSNAQLLYEQSAAFHSVPVVNMNLAYSIEKRTKQDAGKVIGIRNEDGERFKNGYWDNITVRSMRDEDRSIEQGATAVYVGRSTNVGATQRLGAGTRFDREWFLGIQSSGSIGKMPWQAQVEYGSVRERLTPNVIRRAEAYATVALPDAKISENLAFRVRWDFGSFFGNAPAYSWVRPMFGFVYTPNSEMQFSAAYFKALRFGTPQFDIDRLYSSHAIHFRADFKFPATSFGVLLKYDFNRKQLYDIELSISQLMHCIRPYVAYRKDPGAIVFGFELEAQRLFEALAKNNPRGN
ncbi:MAG: hypothetical protein KIT74_09005 [Fimbriimonadales bacterium]|nr:hypothetical protein [Fimbriimonadales bacterium]